jgi:ribonuclease HI
MSVSYQIYIDGSSIGNPGPSGLGAVFKDAQGKTLLEQYDYIGEATNNIAEYRALIMALTEALSRGFKTIEVLTDSELVANQINGLYKVKDTTLRHFFGIARHLSGQFSKFTIRHIDRGLNKEADKLAHSAARNKQTSLFSLRKM